MDLMDSQIGREEGAARGLGGGAGARYKNGIIEKLVFVHMYKGTKIGLRTDRTVVVRQGQGKLNGDGEDLQRSQVRSWVAFGSWSQRGGGV